jgi:dihydrodiol dehydrogenase / D-xylose 1-dehydrogenase (NADP)
MIEAAQRNKRFLMEAFWSRYFPVYRHILKVIQSGEWGEPQVVHANFGIPLDETRHLPGDCETPLVDIGLYTVQFALFVFGDAKLEKITAEGKVDADGCDRWANITLRFAGGKHAVLYYNGDQFVPNSAWVAFRNGKQLVLPEFFWCPTQLLKVTDVTKKTPPEVVNEPLNEEADLSKWEGA